MQAAFKHSLTALAALLFLTLQLSAAAVWQWSVPVPSLEGRRAYLWVPPASKHVRGLVIACQNMLEQPLFERPAFREACAANDLGLVLIFSGHDRGDDDKNPDHPIRSYLDIFLNPNYPHGEEDPHAAGVDLQKALDALALESGYPEIKYAPLMPVGHSSAGSFVWHLYRWDASRIFAMMPLKTGIKSDGPEGIPIFNVESEWFDYGDSSRNVSSKPGDIQNQIRARSHGDASLFGYTTDLGSGHCAVSDDSIKIISLWLKSAAGARLPEDAPLDRPVALKEIDPKTGWLVDIATFGKPETKAVAYADFPGDPKTAFWYPDRALAEAVQTHQIEQLAKKPQQINFLKPDGTVPETGGTFMLTPQYLADGATFRVEARFIEHLVAKTDLVPPDFTFTHGPGPILYKVNSGGLIQTGPDTFRACPRPGPIVPQGQPWEPTIVAYTLGDKDFRPTERPAHVSINILNKDGAPQSLDFPKIANRSSKNFTPLSLQATASSGLPVQFTLVSGPATIKDNTLVFDEIPARARYPIQILLQAFQWGRPSDPKIQSSGPTLQEFFIEK